MPNLVDLSLKDFTNAVAAKTPTPGGGSVGAAAAAQGAALAVMVARFSKGEACAGAAIELEPVVSNLTALVDADAEAYSLVDAALKLPKGTDEEKKRRRESLQSALKKAAEVPLKTMEQALEGMRPLAVLAREGNTNLSSDLGGAVQMLSTGLQIASLNVQVNVAGIRDKNVKQELSSRSSQMMQEAARLVQETLRAMESGRGIEKSK